MASTPTSSLLVQKQGMADNPGTWGDNLNVGLDILDAAVAGATSITTTGGTTTLSDANYTADEAKSMVLDVDGALASNATIVVPLRNKIYAVRNGTSGSYTLTIKTATGTGVEIPQSSSAFVVVDAAADDVDFLTPPTNSTSGVTPITQGGTGATTATDALTNLGLSANGKSLVTAADYAAMRALLDLEAGTDFLSPAAIAAAYQPLDADLTTWAGLTPSANAQSLVTAADYAAMRALLDLESGTDFLSPAAIAAAYQPLDADLTSWAAITRASGFDTFVATPSSANLRALLSDEAGSGAAYFVGGALGTPSSATLTNATGLPSILVANEASDATCFVGFFTAATGELGPKTNAGLTYNSTTNALAATTFIGGSTGLTIGSSTPFSDSAGVLTLKNVDALDATTESTIESAIDTLANLTSIQGVAFTFGAYAATLLNNANEAAFKAAVNLEAGVDYQAYDADLASWAGVTRASGFDTFAATPSSANLRALISDETGSGGALVFANSPTLITPVLGAASGTSLSLSSGTGLTVGSSVPFSDSAGTLTLQNVDALDATTEATIESAIDTLANLTSIQGRAFTFGAYAPTLLNNANEAAFKAAVNLEIGVDVQAYDPQLADLAGITFAQGDILYFDGTNLAKLAAGVSGRFLKTQGAGANPVWDAIPGGGDALTSNPLSQFAPTTSLQLKGVISDETGSGALVFADTPTLVTPILGTPTSGTLTNCTGLPISTGVSGLGTGISAALAINTGSAGAPVINGGALGTPSSGTLTNATGLPISTGVSGLGTNVATRLAINNGIREKLTADTTYYVRTDGSNSNTGLADTAGGAFLTIQYAIDFIATLDTSIYQVTIDVQDATWTENLVLAQPVGALGPILRGNTSTPANCLLDPVAGHCITASGKHLRWTVEGFKFQAGTSGYNLNIAGASITLGVNDWGATGGGISWVVSSQAYIAITSNQTISASQATGFIYNDGGRINWNAGTVTVSGTPAFGAFVYTRACGVTYISGPTFSGSATGSRYNVSLNGAVVTDSSGLTYLPGNASGTTATGGQYL